MRSKFVGAVCLALLCLGVSGVPAYAQAAVAVAERTQRFAADFKRFDDEDRRARPADGGIVFVGSSSIRLWTSLADDFPGAPVLNRGFGGSQMDDVVAFADRTVLAYKPKLVVVYAGDNDLGGGAKTPKRVADDAAAFVKVVHAALPATRIAFISVKPSLLRWSVVDKMHEANALLKAMADADPLVDYIDVMTPMLVPDGRPQPGHFVEDGLHMTPAGYAIWKTAVAPTIAAFR